MCVYHLFLNVPSVDLMHSLDSFWVVIVALYTTFSCKHLPFSGQESLSQQLHVLISLLFLLYALFSTFLLWRLINDLTCSMQQYDSLQLFLLKIFFIFSFLKCLSIRLISNVCFNWLAVWRVKEHDPFWVKRRNLCLNKLYYQLYYLKLLFLSRPLVPKELPVTLSPFTKWRFFLLFILNPRLSFINF